MRTFVGGNFALYLVIQLGWAGLASAQEEPASIPEFVTLRTPTSPAFVLLGITPTTVERPTTPRAVATSFLSHFTEGGGAILPRQFALEVGPYWLWSHPRLTIEDYMGAGGSLGNKLGTSLQRTLSIAVAAADSSFQSPGPVSRDTSIFRLAASVRASPFRGRVADTNCVARLEDYILQARSLYVAQHLEDSLKVHPELENDSEALEALSKALLAAAKESQDGKGYVDEKGRPVQDDCVAALSARTGFILDMAGGVVTRFPAQAFKAGELSGWAIWVTPSYVPNARLSLVGVLRAGKQSGVRRLSQSYTDLGGRGIFAWDRFALSSEIVWRHTSQDDVGDDLYRVNLGFDVKLSGNVWINTAFGRDFNADDAGSLIALANFQYSLGKPAIQPPSERQE